MRLFTCMSMFSVVSLQANVAPNIPQQESQEVSFCSTLSFSTLSGCTSTYNQFDFVYVDELPPWLFYSCFQGQEGPCEMLVGLLLTLPRELLQRWLNHHNIRMVNQRVVVCYCRSIQTVIKSLFVIVA